MRSHGMLCPALLVATLLTASAPARAEPPPRPKPLPTHGYLTFSVRVGGWPVASDEAPSRALVGLGLEAGGLLEVKPGCVAIGIGLGLAVLGLENDVTALRVFPQVRWQVGPRHQAFVKLGVGIADHVEKVASIGAGIRWRSLELDGDVMLLDGRTDIGDPAVAVSLGVGVRGGRGLLVGAGTVAAVLLGSLLLMAGVGPGV
jgi:hypothetical protein